MNAPNRAHTSSGGRDSLRLFVAVLLPQSWLDALAGVQRDLRRAGLNLRYVRPEGIHLTLKFLGETPAERVPALTAALAEASAEARPFPLHLGGLGTFGPPRRPRVVWAGIDGDAAGLFALAAGVERALVPLGIPAERRAFSPHLTLARVPEQMTADEAARIRPVVEQTAIASGYELSVESISLMRSVLGAGGARYSEVAAWRLDN